jgi:hypothetical protein
LFCVKGIVEDRRSGKFSKINLKKFGLTFLVGLKNDLNSIGLDAEKFLKNPVEKF